MKHDRTTYNDTEKKLIEMTTTLIKDPLQNYKSQFQPSLF